MIRRILAIALVLVLIAALMGCSSESETATGDSAAIKDTIQGFFSAYNAEDYDTCLSYIEDADDVGVGMIESMLRMARTVTGTVTVDSVAHIHIADSTATADVTISYGDRSETRNHPLAKKDGGWKIIWE